MAAGEELGVGYVTLTVSTKGLGKDIAKEFAGAEKQASTSGKRMGRAVSDGFAGTVDLDSLAREIEIAEAKGTRAVEKASAAQVKAREKAQDAAAKQVLEEKRLAAARQKAENAVKSVADAESRYQRAVESSGESSREAQDAAEKLARAREREASAAVGVVSAEDKVTRARRGAVSASEAMTRATRDVADAQGNLQKELRRTKDAYAEAEKAAKRAGEDASDDYVDGWRGLAGRLGNVVRNSVDKALSSVGVAGKGFAQGKVYAAAFNKGMSSVKQSSPVQALGFLSGGRVLADMGSHFTNMTTSMDRAIPKLALVSTGVASLAGAALAASSGLLGVVAGLGSIVSVGLLLPGMYAAAGAGLAVLVMAMADAGDVLADLGPKFQALQKYVSGNFWAQAADPIRDFANSVLPILNEGLGAAATEMGRWAGAITGVLGSAQGLGFISDAIGYMVHAADIAGDGIAAMTGALLQLATVGMSYLPDLAGWFNAISYSFEDWVAKSVASGDMFKWIDSGIANLKALGGILFNAIGVFHALGQAAYDAGAGGLIGLASGMKALNDAMHGPVFQGALVTLFQGADVAMQGLAVGVRGLGDAFVALAPTLANVMGMAGKAMGLLIDGLATAISHPVFQKGLTDFFAGVLQGVEALYPVFPVIGEKFGVLATLAGALAANLGKILAAAIEYLAPVLTVLVDAVTPLVPALGNVVAAVIKGVAPVLTFLGGILGGIIDVVVSVVSWFAQFTNGISGLVTFLTVLATIVAGFLGTLWLLATAVQVVTAVVGAFTAVMKVLNFVMNMNPIGLVILAITALVAAFIAAYNNIGWFKDGVNAAFGAIQTVVGAVVAWFASWVVPMFQATLAFLGTIFTWLYVNVIQPVWAGIQFAVAAFVTWFSTVAWPWIQSVIQSIGTVMNWLWINIIQPVWNGILMFLTVVIAAIMTVFQGVVWFVRNVLGPVFSWLYNAIILPVWNAIKTAISVVWAFIRDSIFTPLMGFIRGPLTSAWVWLRNLVSQVWGAIRNAISSIWNWVRDNVLNPAIGFLRNTFGPAWNWLKDRIDDAWTGVKIIVSTGWNWIRDHVFTPFKAGLGLLKDAFNATKDGIKIAWDKLKAAVKEPISFVVNSVVNPFLTNYNKVNDFWSGDDIATIKGFARGGVLPGYQSRKRDDVLTPMRSGEGVLVPEVVRGIGGAQTINALNAAGNTGGVGAVRDLWRSGNLRAAERTASAEQEHGMYAGGPAGAGPSGGLWGAIQTQMNRTGKLYVPNTVVQGRNIAEAAKAWMGQSALDIIPGSGSPSISAGVGHRGPWGFADTSGKVEISTTTPANRVMGTMIHELGHILSLQHSGDGSYGDSSSIMSAGMSGGDWPHAIDYQVLRRVWGEPGKGVTRYSASDVEGVTAASISPMDWIREKLDKYVTGPIKAAKDKFAGNKFVQMGTGVAGKMFDGIKQKAADLLGKLPGFDALADAGKKVYDGVASKVKLTAWMTEALGKKKLLNPGNLASGIARALKESGGDPNIVQQIQDINSGGNEARGLMQVTPSTFRQYMEPGRGNIFDPVDNILASINYTLARYGSVRGGWDQPGGYALGGIVGDSMRSVGRSVSGVWDAPVGTVHALRPGVSTIYNGTGSTEMFQRVDTTAAGTSGEAHLHLHGTEYDESRMLRRGAEEWSRAFRKAGVAA